ncbi:glycosyltransferase family 25 protein [Hydrogenimonas cancrithermarum]|uniref:Glycosyl transferase family 25 domain-containing protein n=1 Tax=Hydrogenimonas cancrithermarum TaxID=2993563 RepID=A0ABN6WWR1_9BACT|nr:glycosyltransferase family 25 protein [Hydrogenimonas cancrithermarum]BDY13443.1 hypothetical protein HCR_17550 [Hydrogenimonas cancrithermarum]
MQIDEIFEHVYVIHVRKGYEERKKHIDKHLPQRDIPHFNYILDGDISDLTDDIIEKHFAKGDIFKEGKAAMSCTYKHILVYREMVQKEIPYALVFEDDVILKKNFRKKLTRYLKDFTETAPFLINIEEAFEYVPLYFRKRDKYLYKAKKTKRTGAYIVNLEAAKKMLEFLELNKYDYPIDHMHTKMSQHGFIDIYWLQPPLALQGSKNGMFDSFLSGNRRTGVAGQIAWFFKQRYHEYVTTNLSKKRIENFIMDRS